VPAFYRYLSFSLIVVPQLGPDVPRAYRHDTARGPEEYLGKTESGKILPPGLIGVRMGFTLQEKSSRARRYATLDPVLPKGQKGELGGRKHLIFFVGRPMTQVDMGII
jgi:hypothetical protein